MYKKISKCRSCNSKYYQKILNLGNQPLANNLLKKRNKIELKFPLTIVYCTNCALVQLSHDINKNKLFSKYFWVTSTSSAAQKFANIFYKKSLKFINKKSFVLEIASNDGLFLKKFKKLKYLGVEPAKNISDKANKNGIKTLNKFFNYKCSCYIKKKYGIADFIFARNVIPHVNNIHSIIRGINNLLSKKGTVAIEFHYSSNILKELQFDSIYHEHIFYFSIQTISSLFSYHKLYPFDLVLSPISGGSVVLYFSKENKKKSKKLINMLLQEKKNNINSLTKWKSFAKNCISYKKKFIKIFKLYKKKNYQINGYGASARSSTLLNFCKINFKNINFIYDKNKFKHYYYTPGSNIEIRPLSKIDKNKDIIVLAWNFYDEIKKYLKKINFRKKIIKPLPYEPKVEKLCK